MHTYGTACINKEGHLEVGGIDVVSLAEHYGTPLYIYDVALIRQRARGLKTHSNSSVLLLRLLMQVKHLQRSA